MQLNDISQECIDGDHNFGQAGRCQRCGIDRADTYPTEKRTGGAGARTHPTTDREYRQQMRKIERGARQ